MSTPQATPGPVSRTVLATIVATIGPASQSADTVGRLIVAGVNVFRFNFSHGSAAEHAARLATVRAASRELGQPVAVLGDLPGPKIRVTRVPGAGIELLPGQDVLIEPGLDQARAGPLIALGATVSGLGAAVQPGHRVLINDGAVRLLCIERASSDAPGAVRCRVTVGGLITSGKGINFPGSDLPVEAITERDRELAAWAVQNEVDYLALSFVRSAQDVRRLRAFLGERGPAGAVPIIAKIEKPQAVAEMEGIVDAADGIMVARGDLGVETDVAMVPVIQRRLLACAGDWGKPCIVATQMLESMVTAAAPTRAEASDVANAVFDGADAVMLSGETAVGRHPVLVVETMKRIIGAAEAQLASSAIAPSPPRHDVQRGHRTAALAHAAWHAAHDYNARVIAVWSQEGGAARYLSQTGFHVPILAYSSSEAATRRMQLLRGVSAVHAPAPPSMEAWHGLVHSAVQQRRMAQPGEAIVLIAGSPIGQRGSPNTIALHRVGEAGVPSGTGSGFHHRDAETQRKTGS